MSEVDKKYKEAHKAVVDQIEILKYNIGHHDAKRCRDPENWGYVGNLNHIIEGLENLNSFLEGHPN